MKPTFKINSKLKEEFPQFFPILEKLFQKNENPKLAIALSWWSDSITLLSLLVLFYKEKGRDSENIHILHCNHKIRKESDDEEKQIKEYLKNYNLTVFHRTIKTKNTEEDLRTRRYQEFDTYCQSKKINYILFWHNLTDRIETSMMNMIRWCWMNWFLNMKTISWHPLLKNTQVIRPLLSYPKEKIEEVCKTYSIPYFEDKTNFDTSTSLRNELRHNYIFPLSKLWKTENNFFKSRNTIYHELENLEKENYLTPLKICPYRNISKAYERTITKEMINKSTISSLFSQLGIPIEEKDIWTIIKWISWSDSWFHMLKWWTLFLAHQRFYIFNTNTKFREKELKLEKKIVESGMQVFGKYQIDIPKQLIWATLRFPKTWDHYNWKLLWKWAVNHKIPLFRRNILPLAEKDKKIIFVFEPKHLIY